MNSSIVGRYLSLVKFSHTIFALPFAAIGFVLGLQKINFHLDPFLALKVLLCMVFARSAAMSFNRWADQHIDKLNPRTSVREIPSGVISSNSALTFTIINCILFIVTTWFINPLCFYLSFVALSVVLGYSYTKRFTALCHLVLGLGLSLAPIGSYLAVTGRFDWLPLFFSFAIVCWVSGFDIIYALQDEQFDRSNHLQSIPGAFGSKKAIAIARNLHISASVFLLSAGLFANLSFIYFIGWGVFTSLLIYQHTLVKANDFSRINLAFFTTNGIASIVFAVFVISDLLR